MPDFGSAPFSQTDASNNSGTMPSWSGSAAPSTLDDAGRALQGAATREWNWRSFTLTATGTSDAKVLSYSVAPAAYYNGQRFAFIANTTNTTSATLNVNSLGAKTIKKDVSGTLTNLAASDMVSGMFVEVAYNTAGDCFVWVNRGALPTFGALAALNTVGTSQIDALAVTTATIAANAVDGTKIALGSDAQGDVMYYDGTNWVRLAAGTSGQFLKTNGAGADPSWVTASGGMTLLATLATTSGNSVPTGTLNLTPYRKLFISLNGISASASTIGVLLNGITFFTLGTAASTSSAWADIDLATGIGLKATASVPSSDAMGITTATTVLTFTTSSGTFDAGSIQIYGVA